MLNSLFSSVHAFRLPYHVSWHSELGDPSGTKVSSLPTGRLYFGGQFSILKPPLGVLRVPVWLREVHGGPPDVMESSNKQPFVECPFAPKKDSVLTRQFRNMGPDSEVLSQATSELAVAYILLLLTVQDRLGRWCKRGKTQSTVEFCTPRLHTVDKPP